MSCYNIKYEIEAANFWESDELLKIKSDNLDKAIKNFLQQNNDIKTIDLKVNLLDESNKVHYCNLDEMLSGCHGHGCSENCNGHLAVRNRHNPQHLTEGFGDDYAPEDKKYSKNICHNSMRLLAEFCTYYTDEIIKKFGDTAESAAYVSEMGAVVIYVANRLTDILTSRGDYHE